MPSKPKRFDFNITKGKRTTVIKPIVRKICINKRDDEIIEKISPENFNIRYMNNALGRSEHIKLKTSRNCIAAIIIERVRIIQEIIHAVMPSRRRRSGPGHTFKAVIVMRAWGCPPTG